VRPPNVDTGGVGPAFRGVRLPSSCARWWGVSSLVHIISRFVSRGLVLRRETARAPVSDAQDRAITEPLLHGLLNQRIRLRICTEAHSKSHEEMVEEVEEKEEDHVEDDRGGEGIARVNQGNWQSTTAFEWTQKAPRTVSPTCTAIPSRSPLQNQPEATQYSEGAYADVQQRKMSDSGGRHGVRPRSLRLPLERTWGGGVG